MSVTRRILWCKRLLVGSVWRVFPEASRQLTIRAAEAEETVVSNAHASDASPYPYHYKPAHKEAPLKSFQTGQVLGTVHLHPFVFGAPPRIDILHRIVVWQRAKRREGLAKVKDRSEVRGGGRKPWKQKGSGRARQGSIRAPHWRGGGVVHGPRGPKSYDYTLPKKVKSLGLRVALSVKYTQGDLTVVDALQVPTHRVRETFPILEREVWSSVLLVDGGELDRNLCYATRNLQKVDVLPSKGLNVYSILLRDKLVLSIGAVRQLEQRLLQDCVD